MKKVFSVKKFEESMIQKGMSKKDIESYKEAWAKKCDGLTSKEMIVKHGCLTLDKWMIEVED